MKKQILFVLIILTSLLMINVGCSIISPEPGVEQIKSDLIGEIISKEDVAWQFAALSEFQEVTIIDKLREGDTIEYNVTMTLQDIYTEEMYTAEVILIYQKSGTHWDLFSILTMSLGVTSNGLSL